MAEKKSPKKRSDSDLSIELRTLGPRITQMREMVGLDKQGLERAAGLPSGRVSRLEKGERMGNLAAETVLKIARAMGGNVGWLLTGEGEMFSGAPRRPREKTGEIPVKREAV